MSKLFKGGFLKKTRNLNKAMMKVENSFKNQSKITSSEETKYFNLPPIEKNLYQKAILQPTSILTRYIEKHTYNFLKNTEEEMNSPIIIPTKIKSKTQFKEKGNKEKEHEKEYEKEKEKENETEKENNRKCITDRGIISKKSSTKFNKKVLYLTETKNLKNISSMSNNISSSRHSSIRKETSNNNIYPLYKKNINIPSAIKVDEELSFEKMKKLDKFFRRLKTYQPKIYTDWKTKSGLSVVIGSITSTSPVQIDIDYQSKIFRDQAKLLEENILYYKMNITSKKNYIDAFKSLSLNSKIKYNKALEETIGIIILLPQLILLDFYKFIKKFENISIPKKHNFEEKYVFDEVENLYFNNKLLSEVLEFFQNCFEVYLLLINEVDDMVLKPKNYNNVITSFEKARYNICYVINASENAIDIYNKDVRIINKFNKSLGIINNGDKKHLTDKLMNQFLFKKNAERQRKIRIDACLNYRKDEEDTDANKKKFVPQLQFKSVIDSELVSKLLKNCVDEAKHKITTERINNEIDGELGEEGEKIKNSKRQVIKLNF